MYFNWIELQKIIIYLQKHYNKLNIFYLISKMNSSNKIYLKINK